MARPLRYFKAFLSLLLGAALSGQALSSVTPAQFFQEAREAWSSEGGQIWGKSLAGPTLLVDPGTRQIWGSEQDTEGQLKEKDGQFVGSLKNDVSIANTAIEWAGKRWSMLLLPLPENAIDRKILLIHESWHRIQPDLGLNMPELPNGHLEKLEGRYWLQLEWRALAKALETQGTSRRNWVAAALACRTRRQSLFPLAVEAERNLELAEGLPEYTAIHAAKAKQQAIKNLRTAKGPFGRSFAYISGPAYGLLLDEIVPGWTRRVRRATDLSVLLQEAYRLPAATLSDAQAAAGKLDGQELHLREEKEERARQQRLALATAPLVKGPTLKVPGPFEVQFDPSNTEILEDGTTFHPTATYIGAWGKLVVTGGSLRSEDWSKAWVSAPTDPKAKPLAGPGWKLELNPGWALSTTEPPGSFQLVPEKKSK